jgi:arsenate reductase
MAEAVLTKKANGRFKAYSAGTRAAGLINPFAIEKIEKLGIIADKLRNKGWEEFLKPEAPVMDFVVTVCEVAANEKAPDWPGSPILANWFFDSPHSATGSVEAKRGLFHKLMRQIECRVDAFVRLPIETLERHSLFLELDAIGQMSEVL